MAKGRRTLFRGHMACRMVRNNNGVTDLLLVQEAGHESKIQLWVLMNIASEHASGLRDGDELFVEVRRPLAR